MGFSRQSPGGSYSETWPINLPKNSERTDCVCLHNEPSVSAFDFDPSYLNVLHRGWKAAPTGELTRWAGSISF